MKLLTSNMVEASNGRRFAENSGQLTTSGTSSGGYSGNVQNRHAGAGCLGSQHESIDEFGQLREKARAVMINPIRLFQLLWKAFDENKKQAIAVADNVTKHHELRERQAALDFKRADKLLTELNQ